MIVTPLSLPGQPSAAADRISAPWWPVFRDLRQARTAFGLKARHLTTLAALLSFLKPGEEQMIVFASNHAILERLNGLCERSFQRHVLDLIGAGLLRRIDSPNGKRYRLRAMGCQSLSFGFDLTPLMQRAEEIAGAARAEAERQNRIALLRQQLLCTLATLEAAGQDQTRVAVARLALRRNLDEAGLANLLGDFRTTETDSLSDTAKDDLAREADQPCPDPADAQDVTATKMSARCGQNVGLYQKSNTEESIDKGQERRRQQPDLRGSNKEGLLKLLRTACPNLGTWFPKGHGEWRDILSQIRQVASWLGITESLYAEAERSKGPECAAATLLAILERADRIRQPAAYFQALTIGKRQASFTTQRLLSWLARDANLPQVIRG